MVAPDFKLKANRINPYPDMFADGIPVPITRAPSEYERENVLFTFVDGERKVITGWNSPQNDTPIEDIHRHGAGYDYENERNAFVIDCIHTVYLAQASPPHIGFPVGELLLGRHGFTLQNMRLTLTDALAYCALYPGNLKVVQAPATTVIGPENPILQGKVWKLVFVGVAEEIDMMRQIAVRVAGQSPFHGFDTVTATESQSPSYQTNIDSNVTAGNEDVSYVIKEDGELKEDIANRFGITVEQLAAANAEYRIVEGPNRGQTVPNGFQEGVVLVQGGLLSIPVKVANTRIPSVLPTVSNSKIDELLKAAGVPSTVTSTDIDQELVSRPKEIQKEKKEEESLDGVDLDDWRVTANNLPKNLLFLFGADREGSPIGRLTPDFALAASTLINSGKYFGEITTKKRYSGRKVYYNKNDDNFYVVQLVANKNPVAFDEGNNEFAENNWNQWISEYALKSALEFEGKFNSDNSVLLSRLYRENTTKFEKVGHYGDHTRPQPIPANTGFWRIGLTIPKSIMDQIPEIVENPPPEPPMTMDALKRALRLISTTGLKRVPFKVSKLKSNIKDSQKVLKEYKTKLEEEQITPSMMEGVNLEEEAQKLDSVMPALENWASQFALTLSDEDNLELQLDESFELTNIFYNGKQVGPPDLQLESFSGLGKSTYGYLLYGEELANINIVTDQSKRPPATEFVQKHHVPSPTIRPTDVKNKVEENQEKGNYPPEATGLGVGSNTFGDSPKKSKPKPSAKTKRELERQYQKRFRKGQQLLGGYVQILNGAGCDTPFKKYLEDAFLIYQLFNGKSTFQQIVGVVIKLLQDEIKLCGQQQALLLRGAGYFDDPNRALRDIERVINREIASCAKVLGDTLEKQILEPGGVPPEVTALIKKGIKPPRGVKLSKTPTGDIWAMWRKQLLNLMISFMKKLILQAISDILEAVAGCGPQEVKDGSSITRNRDPLVTSPYGFVRINALVDTQNVDLTKMAQELGIVNTFYQDDELIKVPALIEQLRRFNEDASDMMTDRDVTAVLQGTGGDGVYNSLFDTVNRGVYAFNEIPTATMTRMQRAPEDGGYPKDVVNAIVQAVQESLNPGDVRYASLNLDKEMIKKYFKRLGQLLGADIALGIDEPLDTKEAYCSRRDVLAYGVGASLDIGLEDLADANDSTVVAGGLSRGQLNRQLDQCSRYNLNKIKTLCERARDSLNFQLEIQNFWDRMGLADFWNKLMKAIREASRKAQGISAQSLAQGARLPAEALEEAPTAQTFQQTNIYQYYSYYFGDTDNSSPVSTLAFDYNLVPSIDNRRVPHYSIGGIKTSFGEDANPKNDKSFGKLILDYMPKNRFGPGGVLLERDTKVRVYFNKGYYRDAGENAGTIANGVDELLVEFDLVDDNTPSTNERRGAGTFSVKQQIANASSPGFWSSNNGTQAVEILNKYIKGIQHGSFGPATTDINDTGGTGTPAEGRAYKIATEVYAGTNMNKSDIVQIATPFLNSMYNVTRTVTRNLYGNPSKRIRDRVDSTVELASVPPFLPSDDPCTTITDETKAIATLNVIHQRLFNFFLNVMPLFNNGYCLETPDTLNMLTAYLQNKITVDIEESGMLSFVVQGLEYVSIAASLKEPVDGIEFNPAKVSDPQDRLKYVISQMFRKMIRNLSTESAILDEVLGEDSVGGWGSLKNNYFEDQVNSSSGVYQGSGVINRAHQYRMLANYLFTGDSFGDGGAAVLRQRRDSFRLPPHMIIPSQAEPGFYRPLDRAGRLRGADTLDEKFERFFRGENAQFLGYVPIPLLVGLQVLYYDKVVDIAGQFPTMSFYAKKRKQTADANLRNEIKETISVEILDPASYDAKPPTLQSTIEADRLRMELEAVERENPRETPAERLAREERDRQQAQREAQEEEARRQRQNQQQQQEEQEEGQGQQGQQQEEQEEEQEEDRAETPQERIERLRQEAQEAQRQDVQRRNEERRRAEEADRARRQAARDAAYPVTIGGRRYNSKAELQEDKRKYQLLTEKADRIRELKIALETRLGIFGAHVAVAENEYKLRGTNLTGKNRDSYDDFIRVPDSERAYRGKIQDLIPIINRNTSLDISQYGSNINTRAGNEIPQRAYSQSRDLKIGNKDSITAADLAVARAYHQRAPYTRQQAMFSRGLDFFKNNIQQAMVSEWAGLKDTRETGLFYSRTILAATSFYGFTQAPPAAAFGRTPPPYSLGTPTQIANRNNTVIGILASITLEIRKLIDLGLMQNLGISEWSPEVRNRVGTYLQQMAADQYQ